MIDPQLIRLLLPEKTFVSKLYYFDELESTNDFAKKNEIPDGSLVITNYQSAGRGRFERKWESERGKNLTFSILKSFDLDLTERIVLVYFAAYTVFSVIERRIGGSQDNHENCSLSIKWPNDIIFNGKKISGILIENLAGSRKAIIGIGINVNQLSFSGDNRDQRTSLAIETNRMTDLNQLLADLIAEFQKNLLYIENRNFISLFDLWKKNNKFIGENVTYLTSAGEKNKAKLEDITQDGRIVLTTRGNRQIFNSSEIRIEI